MKDTPITIRRYTDFAEIKAEEYRYWQSRPAHERWMRRSYKISIQSP